MKRYLVGAFLVLLGMSGLCFAEEVERAQGVVMLHGLARSSECFKTMERALNKAGYKTLRIDYPSTTSPVEVLCRDHVAPKVKAFAKEVKGPLAYVTHSMGGIILRFLAKEGMIEKPFRAVMLGPPNQGSEVVDKLGDLWLFEAIHGPAGHQMGTSKGALPNILGPVNFDVGVIAGTRTINLILSSLIPGPDDGKVSVERTRLQGMVDFRAISATHPFIMKSQEAVELTLMFLEQGHF